MERAIAMEKENFTAVHTDVSVAEWGGVPALRVVKKDKINQYDQNTYAKVEGVSFHNGVIEAKMCSRLLPDAPDFARGFIGLVFRASGDDSEFEPFYVRPTNGRGCTDPVRKAHGCQYFSHPGYTFDYFREFGHGEFFLNGQRILEVEGMKHGPDARGTVGIFVDIGTEAFVAELEVVCED